jgi:hypothetical protein
MAVHMIRFSTAPDTTLQQWVSTWLTNMTAWSEADNQAPTERALEDGTAHYREDWRFAWGSNSKEVLLADLVAYSRSYANWGVIGYHVCEHDGSENQPCPDFDYGLDGGFPASIQSGVWGSPPAGIDPR